MNSLLIQIYIYIFMNSLLIQILCRILDYILNENEMKYAFITYGLARILK
jgi:hypothetical protein